MRWEFSTLRNHREKASSVERVSTRTNPGINPLELMLGMNVNKGLNEI